MDLLSPVESFFQNPAIEGGADGPEVALSKINSELGKRVEEATAELKKLHAAFARETLQRLHVQKEMLAISEREQKRMGQDLHDGIAQQLAGLAFIAKSLYQRMDRKGLAEAAEVLELMDTAKNILEQTRSLSRSFYPLELEKLGLRGALKDLSNNTGRIFQIQCPLQISPDAEAGDPFIATHLYRIAQEAVHNAIKHGKARRIEIDLFRLGNDGILQIKDNGVGFLELDKAKPGCMGLKIMEYRAQMIGGSLAIEQRQGEGTGIIVKWKLQ
jgi:signal transduction histidine kinase